MIASLKGTILEKNPPQIVVDVQGVGYELDVPMSTFYNLPESGDEVFLKTVMIVREDAHLLYGFLTAEEKNLFKLLLKVSGIGPRTALAILSSMSPADFGSAVSSEEIGLLTKIPGIGKKTAERMVLELKDKVLPSSGSAPIENGQVEILQALCALGFSDREARSALKQVPQGAEVSEGIRICLKHLAQKG